MFRPSFLLALVFCFVACQNATEKSDMTNKAPRLGEVDFKVSGLPEAQADFERGLLYLHSFEYFDSMHAFQAAQQKDPNFGMAYWGELMSYNHGLWARQLYTEAQSVLARMGATPEERLTKFKTPLEKDLFKAMEILYGKGSKNERDAAYRSYLAELYAKYPRNHEVATFYAISILGGTDSAKQQEDYNKSAEILSKVLKENPIHPGALHYFIHSRDYPEHADQAAEVADRYAKVAPDAAHALHMPSHIYIAQGRWNDVVNSNIDSWNASVHTNQEHPMMPTSYHALSWLHYALLQRGENDLALKLLNDMKSYAAEKPTQSARVYLLAMKGAHMVETNTWDGPVSMINANIADLNVAKKAGFFYIEGIKALLHKRPDMVQSIIKTMQDEVYRASLNVGQDKIQMCNATGAGSKPPTQKDIDMTNIMIMQLQAGLAKYNGESREYFSILKAATALEDKVTLVFGPPTVFKPIYEQYAEALVEGHRYDEAEVAYDKLLEKHPRRLISLKGKLNVAKKLGKQKLAEELAADLKLILSKKPRKAII